MNPNPPSLCLSTLPSCQRERVDQLLVEWLPHTSRACIQRWIKDGHILVDDGPAPKRLGARHTLTVHRPETLLPSVEPQDLDLSILYEDECMLVVSKPVGQVVHPGAGQPSETLMNALHFHRPECQQLPRAGIIHRLDKDTSGLLVVAKTAHAHSFLIEQMRTRTIKRFYRALAHGHIRYDGHVDEPIGRHPKKRTLMAVHPQGKPAKTHYRVLSHLPGSTWLDIELETGRTHQIRVHCNHIGHPLVGDDDYGGRRRISPNLTTLQRQLLQLFPRQALHAYRLSIPHPDLRQERVVVDCPLAEDIQTLLNNLKTSLDEPGD